MLPLQDQLFAIAIVFDLSVGSSRYVRPLRIRASRPVLDKHTQTSLVNEPMRPPILRDGRIDGLHELTWDGTASLPSRFRRVRPLCSPCITPR
jgi:hypothetical protein